MVHQAVNAGKPVSWVVLENGNGSLGTAAFALIDLPIPYKNGVEASLWPLVADKVYVQHGEIKLLDRNELYLNDDDDTHFPCVAILCGTGWKDGLRIFDSDTLMELGLPYPKGIEPQEETAKWEELVDKAEEKVLERFVMLRRPPVQ
ncbi:hypothetical protein F5Y11DRAFT_365386 [Daldinia sp. FL1419]|nr:hypothetical protein F5Y11DRAFT_365386 [Daldinia sp. FL1419]